MYLAMDYSAPMDSQILNYKFDESGTDEMGRLIISGLKAERRSMFGGQLLRTLGFMALMLAILWMFMKNTVKPWMAVAMLAVITLIDQLVIDKDYLNEDNYVSKDELASETTAKTRIDEQILADKALHFRVYNAGQQRFSAGDYHTSAFHRSIGGYHPAKLRIYDDIIRRYLNGGSDPQQILNMLNVRYYIVQNPQNGQESLIPNMEAYGPAWFVKGLKIVNNDVEEIQAIGITNLRDSVVIQQSFANGIAQPQFDSSATITLSKYDNDDIEYVTSSASPQFAVLSEIYYPSGWNAYLDGKKVDYVKANYILRGIAVPAGKHTIRFAFEPETYKKGVSISFIGSILVIVLVLGGLFMATRKKFRS
jgi:hypothetical protein